MSNSPQCPDQPNGDDASAVTLDDVIGALVATAASGIPAAMELDDFAALGLTDDHPLFGRTPAQKLDTLAAAHGCVLSGPYLGDGEEVGIYYLFERIKPG